LIEDGAVVITNEKLASVPGVSGGNNPFDWVRSANQATDVDCVAILAIRAAGAVGGLFRPETPSLSHPTPRRGLSRRQLATP
jgi:hypothetical protein